MTRNDKKRRIKLPLALKIWLMLISLVIACLGLVYLFTIVFLEQYYVDAKEKTVVQFTEQAVEQVLSYDFFDRSAAQQDSMLDELAMSNNLCIDVMYASGVEIAAYEGIGAPCYVHMTGFNRGRLFATAMQNPYQLVINEIKHPQFDTQYFVCCRYFTKQPSHPNGGITGYVVMVTASLANVTEAAGAIRSQLISISWILLLAATLIAFALAFWITRPMKKLSEAAKAVAQGNLDTEVHITSSDEIGACGEDFNEMVERLRTSNRMQREMIANVSHDLRTPLTMIRGYAESIQDIVGEDKVERDRQLSIIIDETDRLSKLVTDIMDLSLLQAGKLKLNQSDFSIVSLMSDVLGRFLFLQEKEDFALDLCSELPQGDAICHADAHRIEQVLYNFVNNAAAHSRGNRPDGSPIPRSITLKAAPAEKGFVRISVCDKGEGIAEQELVSIWDRYYKPYRTAGGVNRGTGLGLSIVKAIMEEHRLPYGVNSVLNEGSEFWFELPVVGADESTKESK